MKSHVKRIAVLIYQGISLLIATFFSQIVLVLILIYNQIHQQSFTNFQSSLLMLCMALAIAATYYWAKWQQLLPGAFKLQKGEGMLVAWGMLTIFIINFLGNIFLTLSGTNATANQAAINDLFRSVPLIPMVVLTVSAGFFEELLYRRWLFALFGRYRAAALMVSSVFFCLLHSPSDFASVFIYFGMGIVLGYLYYRTNNIYTSMLLHILWNSLGVLPILLSLFIGQ